MSIPLGPVALSNLRGITLSLSNFTYSIQGGIVCGGDLDTVDIIGSECTFNTVTTDLLTVTNTAQVWSGTFTNLLTIPEVTDLTNAAVLSATPDGSLLFNRASGLHVVLSSQYEPVHTPYVSQMYVNKYSTTTNNAGLYILSGTTTKAQITVSSNESLVLSCVNYQLQPSSNLSKLVYTTAAHNKYIDGTVMTHTVRTDATNSALAANTYVNFFGANPVLSAGYSYRLEFVATLTGLSDANNANMSLRLSGGTGIAFTTVMANYDSQYGTGNSGSFVTAADTQAAQVIVNQLSSAGFQVTAAAPTGHQNRFIRGNIIVDVTATGGLYLQFSQSDGPSNVVLKAGSYLRVTCLGTANGSNLTDGSYV